MVKKPHCTQAKKSYFTAKCALTEDNLLVDGKAFNVDSVNDLKLAVEWGTRSQVVDFISLFIWGFTSLSTLYRPYHDG